MILVLSHAWIRDTPGAEQGYRSVYEAFGVLHSAQPGFVERRLVQDNDDPLHLLNLRWFDQATDYEALVSHPDYGDWIGRLSRFVEHRDPEKVIARLLP